MYLQVPGLNIRIYEKKQKEKTLTGLKAGSDSYLDTGKCEKQMNVTQLFSNQRGISDQRSEMLARPLWSPQPTGHCVLYLHHQPRFRQDASGPNTRTRPAVFSWYRPPWKQHLWPHRALRVGGRPDGGRGLGQVDALQQVRVATAASTSAGLGGVQLGFKDV